MQHFYPGCWAKLKDLKKKKDLNGKVVIICGTFSQERNRWPVLCENESTVCVKEINLESCEMLKQLLKPCLVTMCLEFLFGSNVKNKTDFSCPQDFKIADVQTLGHYFPEIKELEFSDDSYEGKISVSLKFAVFPRLTNLDIMCCSLPEGLILTRFTTPMLEYVNLSNISDEIGPFKIECPNLKDFCAEHTFVDDAWGVSKSWAKCPKLRRLQTYKFRGLSEQIWIMPSIENISLHRAECFEKLTILYAPKLKKLNVQAAYNLSHIRIYNCKSANVDSLVEYEKFVGEESKRIEKKTQSELKKWEDGTYGREEAICRNIIEVDEEYQYGEMIKEIVEEELWHETDQRFKLISSMTMQKLLSQANHQDISKPKIHVYGPNMTVNGETSHHLDANPRVISDLETDSSFNNFNDFRF